MKQSRIKIKDLGPSYAKYKKTEFDFFSRNEEVRELTGTKPIIIRFKTFRLKKYDEFTKRSSTIYARFKYAKKLNIRFDKQLVQMLNNDFKGESRKTIRAAIKRRSAEKLNSVRRLKETYESLKLSLKSCKDLVADARELIKVSDGIYKQSKATLMKDPEKAILTDKLFNQSRQTLSRLQEVITGSPKLITSLQKSLKISDVTQAIKGL